MNMAPPAKIFNIRDQRELDTKLAQCAQNKMQVLSTIYRHILTVVFLAVRDYYGTKGYPTVLFYQELGGDPIWRDDAMRAIAQCRYVGDSPSSSLFQEQF